MKIGLLICGGIENLSGGCLYDRMLCAHFRARGDSVTVISLPRRTSFYQTLPDNFLFDPVRASGPAGFDVLLEDELCHPSLFLRHQKLRNKFHYPVVSIVHHLLCSEKRSPFVNSLYRFRERLYLQRVDGFVFNSRSTMRSVQELVGTGKPHVIAYPGGDRFGLSNAAETHRPVGGGPFTMLFVGNLIPRKGLDFLLSALELIRDMPWKLLIAGSHQADPAYARRIRRLAERSGLKDRTEFLGEIPDEALPSILAGSDIFVLPSHYEGFGICCLEALGFGLPILTSSSGGVVEIVRHGINGYLVPPEDRIAFAGCISNLIKNPGRLAVMRTSARESFRKHDTWDISACRVRNFLRNFLDSFAPKDLGGIEGR